MTWSLARSPQCEALSREGPDQWITVFALNLAAVAANTSRGAQAVAGLILIGLIIHLGPTLVRRMSRAEMNVTLAGAAAILFLLFALAQASHLERSSVRWQK